MRINRSAARHIRKPNVWGTYTTPIDNLMHAILIQAASDANGYIDTNKRYNNGDEAAEFLDTVGREWFGYLLTRPRSACTYAAQKSREESARKEGVQNENS